MARMDYDKAHRAGQWRQSVRDTWSGHVPSPITRATDKQTNYIKVLLEKHGRRPFTAEEIATLTVASASRLIAELNTADK